MSFVSTRKNRCRTILLAIAMLRESLKVGSINPHVDCLCDIKSHIVLNNDGPQNPSRDNFRPFLQKKALQSFMKRKELQLLRILLRQSYTRSLPLQDSVSVSLVF